MNERRFREAEERLWQSFGLAPTERRVHLPRIGANVRVQEIGEGPPVVFVHGGSNGGSSWAPLVAKLNFRCLLLDRPGCGLSEPTSHRHEDVGALATFADMLLVDLLDALHIDTAHVVATSFGGYIALRTAAAHPGRIGRLVEAGWTIGAPSAGFPLMMRIASVPALARLMTAVPLNARMVKSVLRSAGLRQALAAGRVSDEAIGWYLALLRDTGTMANEIKAGPRIITLRGMNESILLPHALLASISTPVYFLWGEEDPFGGADIARAFTAYIPSSQLEIMPGAGHAPWMDDPDYAAASVMRWLS
jgi:pimeloyl-ACP methyl ester carboxylesterase